MRRSAISAVASNPINGTPRLPLFVRNNRYTCGMRFEYATVPLLTHATKQILDQWGADGWDLVTVLPGPTGEQHVAYMKRQLED